MGPLPSKHYPAWMRGPLSLRGDRDLLFQAFANLLDNAIRHTARGSVRVEARLSVDSQALRQFAPCAHVNRKPTAAEQEELDALAQRGDAAARLAAHHQADQIVARAGVNAIAAPAHVDGVDLQGRRITVDWQADY